MPVGQLQEKPTDTAYETNASRARIESGKASKSVLYFTQANQPRQNDHVMESLTTSFLILLTSTINFRVCVVLQCTLSVVELKFTIDNVFYTDNISWGTGYETRIR